MRLAAFLLKRRSAASLGAAEQQRHDAADHHDGDERKRYRIGAGALDERSENEHTCGVAQ